MTLNPNLTKDALKTIYLANLKDEDPFRRLIELANILGEELHRILKHMVEEGLIEIDPRSIDYRNIEKLIGGEINKYDLRLTDKGRRALKIGLIGGVFDLIHIGHISILKRAKSYVDVLIVVVATDSTVVKSKDRMPINSQEIRREIVNSIRYVDYAFIGDENDFSIPLNKVDPDIIFLGYDQKIPPGISGEDLLNKQVIKINIEIKGVKTSKIIETLRGGGRISQP